MSKVLLLVVATFAVVIATSCMGFPGLGTHEETQINVSQMPGNPNLLVSPMSTDTVTTTSPIINLSAKTPVTVLSSTGQSPAGEAYMYQAGPTTIPPQLCEPLDISMSPPPSITIEPVGWYSTGEPFMITGKTLLPADQEILIEVMMADFMSHKSRPGDFFGQTGTVRITTGLDGIGRWEYTVNTSGWIPDRYLVQVIPVSENAAPFFTDHFYLLSPEEATAIRELPVMVDPVPYHYDGETFPIAGNTTLPRGQELTVSVMPGSSLRMDSAIVSQGNEIVGVVGKTRVESGSNGVNRWSFRLNTTGFGSTTYVIDIFSLSGERIGCGVFFLDYNPGRVCRILTVPVTPALTPTRTSTAATLPAGIVIVSLLCVGLHISWRLKR